MPDQFSKLIGYAFKYPYLVGISTDSGNFGSGILISAKFVLTCGHVLQDSCWAEVVTREGSTSARVQKVDDSLDLALLELTRPISAPKAKFTDSHLQPGSVLLAVGVQATPGQPDVLSVAEIKLRHRNQNDADGMILDIQLEGGARPGYSGGPVIVKKGGALLCVGVMRRGGAGATATNAVGLGSIRAFVEEYIPDMTVVKSGTHAVGIHRLLIFIAILFSAVVVGTIAWHYLASKAASGQEGNPDVKVWVNTSSSVYHCPGTADYGKSMHGEYMTQAEAQKKANRPAYGKVCK